MAKLAGSDIKMIKLNPEWSVENAATIPIEQELSIDDYKGKRLIILTSLFKKTLSLCEYLIVIIVCLYFELFTNLTSVFSAPPTSREVIQCKIFILF